MVINGQRCFSTENKNNQTFGKEGEAKVKSGVGNYFCQRAHLWPAGQISIKKADSKPRNGPSRVGCGPRAVHCPQEDPVWPFSFPSGVVSPSGHSWETFRPVGPKLFWCADHFKFVVLFEAQNINLYRDDRTT